MCAATWFSDITQVELNISQHSRQLAQLNQFPPHLPSQVPTKMSHMTCSLQRVLGSRVASHPAASAMLLRSRANAAAVVVRSSSSSSSSSNAVAPPDIKQLAKMAQIGVTDEEVRLGPPLSPAGQHTSTQCYQPHSASVTRTILQSTVPMQLFNCWPH